MDHKEARKLWVEALRSGEYKQGTQFLHRDDAYCCLGVACELFNKHQQRLNTVHDGARNRAVLYGEDRHDATCPREVMLWLGLTYPCANYGRSYSNSLTGDNDRGKTFAEIADIIESEPEGLFVD